MAVLHDITPKGRLLALLEMCEMLARRGDMRHMPGLLALVDQTRRVVDAQTRIEMEAKQIEFSEPSQAVKAELPI